MPKQRKLTVYVINAGLLIAVCLLQYSPYAFYKISTAVPVFAVGLTCAVAAFFGEWHGAAWGALAGVCMDALSADSVCFHTLTLMVVGLVCGILMSHLLNSNYRACLVLCFIASAIFFVSDWFFNYLLTRQEHWVFLLKHAIPSAVYTALTGFLFILLYSFIYNKLFNSKT